MRLAGIYCFKLNSSGGRTLLEDYKMVFFLQLEDYVKVKDRVKKHEHSRMAVYNPPTLIELIIFNLFHCGLAKLFPVKMLKKYSK